MQFNQATVIIMLGLFAVGFIAGAAIAWILAGRQKEPPAPNEQDPWQSLRSRYTERASLWNEQASGKLTIRLDNQMVNSVDQLTDIQRKNLNQLMKDWLGWMGFPGAKASTAEPTPSTSPAATVPPTQPVSITPPPNVESQPAQAPAQPAQNKAPEKPKSIVEQIDEILQEKIKASAVPNRGVRLSEDPREGVVVWVGLDHFAGVDTVTDPDIRALVRSAVTEWEQRQTPRKG